MLSLPRGGMGCIPWYTTYPACTRQELPSLHQKPKNGLLCFLDSNMHQDTTVLLSKVQSDLVWMRYLWPLASRPWLFSSSNIKRSGSPLAKAGNHLYLVKIPVPQPWMELQKNKLELQAKLLFSFLCLKNFHSSKPALHTCTFIIL